MLPLYSNIRKIRIEKGLSQQELAKLIGYTDRSSIAKIESGKVDLTQSKIKAIADALCTTPGELMGEEETTLPEDNVVQIPIEYQKLSKEDREMVDGIIIRLANKKEQA